MNPAYRKAIDELFLRANVENHPFYRALRTRAITSDQFRRGALQIYYVVQFFPRFLAALISNMEDHRERLDLVGNLYEEHGHMKEEHFHITTYRAFLGGLAVDSGDIRDSKPIPAVVAYTRAVYDLCLHYPYLQGVGALGVIEQIVAMVSPIVASAALGFIPADKLVHFDDHAVFDVTHADEIYRIADAHFDVLSKREDILLGMSLGMYYHLQLYTGISAYLTEGEM